MLVMTCDKCGTGISRSQKEAVVRVKLNGVELRADLCEVCQNLVKTDIAVVLARWEDARLEREAKARLTARGVATPSRTREPSHG